MLLPRADRLGQKGTPLTVAPIHFNAPIDQVFRRVATLCIVLRRVGETRVDRVVTMYWFESPLGAVDLVVIVEKR